jgi:hypothetical protein
MSSFLLVLTLLLCLVTGCGTADTESGSGDATADGKISATIILVLEDETQVKYPITVTKDSTLRDALHEAKLISDDDYYDLFVQNIDGHVANVYDDGCTWLPQDTDGNQIMGSFDEIIVEDNETIYLVYYVVPDMD